MLAALQLPRALRPLRHPALACLWTGLATSAIGDQLFMVALSWVAVQVLGTRAGYLTAAQPAVILVVAMLAGRWADRIVPRRLMIGADLGRALALMLLLVTWLAAGQPPAWTLVLAVLALAAGQALFRPALQAVLPPLAGDPALLPAANGLLETTDRIARLVGPGLVGVMAALIPLAHYVTVDIATFLASALAIAATVRLRPLPAPPATAAPALARQHVARIPGDVRAAHAGVRAGLCGTRVRHLVRGHVRGRAAAAGGAEPAGTGWFRSRDGQLR